MIGGRARRRRGARGDEARTGRGGYHGALLARSGGLGSVGAWSRGQPVAPIPDGQRAIEVGMDVDAGAGVAAAAGPRAELEEAPVELHGVIALDGAGVLEAADALEVGCGRRGAPGGGGVRRRVCEVSVVARDEPVEHALRLRERTGVGEAEFDDEAILEGAEEPFDAALTRYEIVGCLLPSRCRQ
jgi:hypothetical protein